MRFSGSLTKTGPFISFSFFDGAAKAINGISKIVAQNIVRYIVFTMFFGSSMILRSGGDHRLKISSCFLNSNGLQKFISEKYFLDYVVQKNRW